MSVNTEFKAEFQMYGGAWIDSEAVSFRNVTGSACSSVARTAFFPPVPGVLRFTVLSVAGTTITLSCSVINVADAHHPSIDDSLNMTSGALNRYNNIDITLAGVVSVGDVFEVAYGYSWDTAAGAWAPSMAMGILVPGESSQSVFVKITNIAARARANVVLAWENDGPDFVSAKRSDSEEMIDPSVGQIYLQDANGIEGYMAPAGECILEFRAAPSASLDSTYNMVQVDLMITSLAI